MRDKSWLMQITEIGQQSGTKPEIILNQINSYALLTLKQTLGLCSSRKIFLLPPPPAALDVAYRHALRAFGFH